MGNWKQHLSIGVVIELALILFLYLKFQWFKLDFVTYIVLLVIIAISPLIMDLDHRNGKLREIFLIIGLNIGNIGIILWTLNENVYVTEPVWANFLLLGVFISSAVFFIPYLFKHRNQIHSIVFCLIYGLALYFIFKVGSVAIIGSVGAYSHLLVDKIPFKLR